MATYTVTTSFSADTTAIASEVNQNFTDVLTALNSFAAANLTGTIALARISNLTSSQMAAAFFKDEDDMASDSATAVATQQSIKAYVDSGTVVMTNKTLTSPVLNTFTGSGGAIVQTATTGNALTVTRDLASASTNAAVVKIIQDNAGDDQGVLAVQNDGTGAGMSVDNNSTGYALYVDNAGTNHGIFISQVGVSLVGDSALYVQTSAAQTNNTGMLHVNLTNASSTCQAMKVSNAGTGNSLLIDLLDVVSNLCV